MELSNFVIFLFFILNLFDLTFCVEPKTNGGSSNTRPNSLTIFQEKEVDVPPGFAPRPRISPPQNNQSHVTTREYSDRLQQFIRPVILTPRQNFQSSDKNIRTLYDGDERAPNFSYFQHGQNISFGGHPDSGAGNIQFNQPCNFNQHLSVPPGYNLPGTVKKHAKPVKSLPFHRHKSYNAIGVSKGKGKQVDIYDGQKGEGSGERGSRDFPMSSRLKMRGDGKSNIEVPFQETAAQREQNINGTTTKEEIQKLINSLNKSLQANRRKNYIDKRRYKQYKANIEKEYEIRRMESNEFLKGIKDIAKKSRKNGEDFKQQKILEFNSMMGNDNK